MLSNAQKAALAILAKRAFEKLRPGGADDGISEEDFRHQQVAKACGKFGLRCCGQDDFKPVKAHFLNLLGESGQAMRIHYESANEPLAKAHRVLMWTLKRYGYRQDYAEAICQCKYKCTVGEAGAHQVWTLVYDVQGNGQSKLKREKIAA